MLKSLTRGNLARCGYAAMVGVSVVVLAMSHSPGGEFETEKPGPQAASAAAEKPPPGTLSPGEGANMESGRPLIEGEGELGRAAVWVFDRGVAVSGKNLPPKAARQLLTALEKTIRQSHTSVRQPKQGGASPSRDEILRSGWVVELRYELPVRQRKLGFVSPTVARLLELNQFLIPLSGEYAQTVEANRQRARLFPYEAIKVLSGKLVVQDWCADSDSVVFSTYDVQEVARILAPLGMEAPVEDNDPPGTHEP
jgi:hypothetical protein